MIKTDELTTRLVELEKEQKEHPERFQIILVCDNCGRRRTRWFGKDEVTRYKEKHNGSTELHQCSCEKCEKQIQEEEQDEEGEE